MNIPYIIFLAVEAALAIILCFFGYKARKVTTGIYSFMFLFFILYPLSAPIKVDEIYKLIGCALLSLILAAIVCAVYNIAMFLAGGGIGLVAGIFFCHYFKLGFTSTAGLIIIIALTLAASSLSMAYKKPLLVLSSAALGAFLISALAIYTYTVSPELGKGLLALNIRLETAPELIETAIRPMFDYVLIGTGVLGVAGALTQFGMNKK